MAVHPAGLEDVSAAVSLCCGLERLTEACQGLHDSATHLYSLTPRCFFSEHTCAVGVSSQLLETLCHQTALYCSKLLRGEGRGREGGEGLEECCEQLHASLDSVAELLGQLLLVREIEQNLLSAQFRSQLPSTSGTGKDEGNVSCQWPPATDQVSSCMGVIEPMFQVCVHVQCCRLKAGLRHGVGQASMSALNTACQTLHSDLSTLASLSSTPATQIPSPQVGVAYVPMLTPACMHAMLVYGGICRGCEKAHQCCRQISAMVA